MKRNGFLLVSILVASGIFGLSVFSYAQEESESSSSSSSAEASTPSKSGTRMKERRTTLDFEDELVEGTNQKPDMIYLFQQKNFNYKRLIKHREHFLPEMRETAEDVQRIRSDN